MVLTFNIAKVKMNIVKYSFAAASMALITACGGGSTPAHMTGASAVVTTLAGTALRNGSTDATGPAAMFDNPASVAVDANGNVYIADAGTIRKITAAGVVTTLAGTSGLYGSTDATGAAARFFGPSGVAVGANGNIYVADSANHTIRYITMTP